jgi:hypothetical protein
MEQFIFTSRLIVYFAVKWLYIFFSEDILTRHLANTSYKVFESLIQSHESESSESSIAVTGLKCRNSCTFRTFLSAVSVTFGIVRERKLGGTEYFDDLASSVEVV